MRGPSRLLTTAGVLTLLFLYLPILVLIVFSFNKSRYGVAWGGFTLDWYARLLENRAILRSALNSLIVAAASCALATVLGTLAAVAHGRFAWKRPGIGEGLFFLPLIIPELMMAVGFLLFFGLLGWDLGLPTLIVAHTTFNLPFVWLIVRSRLKKLDPRLEEAAMDLGATRWMAFRKVTFPLLMPAILSGALMAFAISLDDFFISFFVSGPDSTTLPIQIYSMLKFSIDPQVNALSAALFVASMALVVAAWLFQEDAYAR